MPISDHYHRSEKLAVRIITVDTTALRVEGVGKDAAVIQISVGHRPAGFRWPIEGELWIVERETTDWTLVAKIESPDVPALTDGEPGDLMGPDGWITQGDKPTRYNGEQDRLEVREAGLWTPVPGVAPEVHVGPTTPAINSGFIISVDTDEPGVDLSDWAGLDSRVDALEAAPAWINLPTLAAGWVHYDQGQYFKGMDMARTVECRGELQTNASTSPDGLIFTFPSGYWPVKRHGFTFYSNESSSARPGYVSTDGTVRSVAGFASGITINIGSLRFPTR